MGYQRCSVVLLCIHGQPSRCETDFFVYRYGLYVCVLTLATSSQGRLRLLGDAEPVISGAIVLDPTAVLPTLLWYARDRKDPRDQPSRTSDSSIGARQTATANGLR